MLVVVASLKVKGGQPARLRVSRALNVLAQATRKNEAACSLYAPGMSTEDYVTFTVTEFWESPEAMENHFKTDHFNAFLKEVGDELDGPPVITKADGAKIIL